MAYKIDTVYAETCVGKRTNGRKMEMRVKYEQVEGIPILSDMLQLYISVDIVTVPAPPHILGTGFVGYGL